MKLYFRLAAGGIRRNSRLYVPYIMTCSLMVMMYYITDALSGDEMLSAMAGGYIMHELIVIGKVVMALFAAIFLFYTNSFLIKSRMREFGLYNILGMGKNGIARVMTWETLMVYVISMVFGLGAGILFSKLAELLAVKIVQGDAAYQFSVSGTAAAASLIVFAVIFLLIFLNVLRQVFFSKPVELLRSENSGEKPPKANWFAAVLGALMLGLAYFMAVTIEEPLSAILAFMAAVLLVIAATYLLFVAGSVVLCRVLQKNKGYYYKTNHFISVSQMSYRMRKNGAGLASICILSTMVLVTLSTTICLYMGEEQILRQRYPRDMVTMTYGLPEEDIPAFRESVGALAEKHGASPENVLAYSYAELSGAVIGNRLDMARGNSDDVSLDLRSVYVVPIADYNALYGTDIQLADGEAAAYFKGKGFGCDEIQLDDWGSYRITQRLGEFTITGTDSATIYDTIYLFVKDWSDLESLNDYQNRLTDEYGGMRSNIVYYYCFDLDCGEDSQLDLYYEMEYGDMEFPFHFERLKTECRARDHEEFLGLYGGLFFLGILFGGVFILAAVLIMYYKQISEGFNDRARFDILRKVGMNDREIRRAVNSQVLTVFFAPLIAAGIHMAFAFPLLTKILGMFSMRDAGFLAIVTLICFAVFAVLGWNMHSEAIEARPVRQVYADASADEHFVSCDELPEFYVNAVTATEDRDFWGHSGIDPSAIVRALLHDIAAMDFAEGGSTITMQTAKNIYYTQDKRFERKAAEVFTAFELEDKLRKEQIFELYVNTIYFGSNYYGIYAASMGYYGVPPQELTDQQCATLAGIPQAPSVYSPDNSQELADQRAEQVLNSMRECGYLS